MDLDKLANKIFDLGQRYWQQADNERVSENKKADTTLHEFQKLKAELIKFKNGLKSDLDRDEIRRVFMERGISEKDVPSNPWLHVLELAEAIVSLTKPPAVSPSHTFPCISAPELDEALICVFNHGQKYRDQCFNVSSNEHQKCNETLNEFLQLKHSTVKGFEAAIASIPVLEVSACDRNQLLKVEIADGKLNISIGIEALCTSCEYGVDHSVEIHNKDLFAEELRDALVAESENGTTFLHTAFDDAAWQMIENGASSVTVDGE